MNIPFYYRKNIEKQIHLIINIGIALYSTN